MALSNSLILKTTQELMVPKGLFSNNFVLNSEIEFEKKAKEQLHFRSLCLINTQEFAQFNAKISSIEEKLSLNSLEKTLGLPKYERKKEEAENDLEDILLKLFKENQFIDEGAAKEEALLTQPIPNSSSKLENSLDWLPILPFNYHPVFDKSLNKELKEIVQLILKHTGKDDNIIIERSRSLYTHNTFLIQTYDALVRKYNSSTKSKEDIVRYIFRKMLKVAKKPIKETEKKVNGKKASLLLCKRYFPHHFNLIDENTESNEQELLESLMPFSQKSKNKTLNANFVQEMFSSETFLKDYQGFLLKIEYLLEEDNKKKLDKLLDTLIQCVKNNNFKNVGSLKVFPWLDTWIEDTKNIAVELWQKKAWNPPRRQKKSEQRYNFSFDTQQKFHSFYL